MSEELITLESEAKVDEERPQECTAENIRAVRVGHGANCSSVGSVIDTLFMASALGGAIFAAVCAALAEEEVRVVGRKPAKPSEDDEEEAAS